LKRAKIDIVFRNPNTDEETAKYITAIFIEASRVKFENILKDRAAEQKIEAKKESP
jgi:hypothetical protein